MESTNVAASISAGAAAVASRPPLPPQPPTSEQNVEACNACKYLRRRCEENCIFAACFPHTDDARRFEVVHRVYGASNVSKILAGTPPQRRREAAKSLVYDAEMRIHDPIYGSPGTIYCLHQKLKQLQEELQDAKLRLNNVLMTSQKQQQQQDPPLQEQVAVQLLHEKDNMELIRRLQQAQLLRQQQQLGMMKHKFPPQQLQLGLHHVSGFEGNPSLQKFPAGLHHRGIGLEGNPSSSLLLGHLNDKGALNVAREQAPEVGE